MTGLSEEKLLQKKPDGSTVILKTLCMQCKRKNDETFHDIAKIFNLSSHSTVISNLNMLDNNQHHPKIKQAKQIHKCYRKDEVCIIPVNATEAKEILQETLEDILNRTSCLSKDFEEIVRQMRNRDIRNSPQRISCKI